MIKPNNHKTQHFSLVELLVSLAIFMIMMGFLFTLFNGANKAWSRSDSNTRVYDRGRAILNIISTDLQNAVVSKEARAEIPFWPGGDKIFYNGKQIGRYLFAAVCNMEEEKQPITTMCEVVYIFNEEKHEIQRYVTYDKWITPPPPPAININPNWNFLGTTSNYLYIPTPSPGHFIYNKWWKIPTLPSDKQRCGGIVIDGVEDCKIEFPPTFVQSPTLTPLKIPTANILPRIVRITITIYDPMVEANQRNKTKRTFSKLIYLPSAGQF